MRTRGPRAARLTGVAETAGEVPAFEAVERELGSETAAKTELEGKVKAS